MPTKLGLFLLLALGCATNAVAESRIAGSQAVAARQEAGSELQVSEMQSIGCVLFGGGLLAAAIVTGAGPVAASPAGAAIANFVTYFATGCVVGAITAPLLSTLRRQLHGLVGE